MLTEAGAQAAHTLPCIQASGPRHTPLQHSGGFFFRFLVFDAGCCNGLATAELRLYHFADLSFLMSSALPLVDRCFALPPVE